MKHEHMKMHMNPHAIKNYAQLRYHLRGIPIKCSYRNIDFKCAGFPGSHDTSKSSLKNVFLPLGLE